MQTLLQDNIKDQLLYSTNRALYLETLKNRRIRRNNNYISYITSQYPTYPNVTLTDLEYQKQKLILRNNEKPSNQLFLKIQEIQSKIDNQNYCVEGTPEWTARQEFLSYSANFVWPDANEASIRQQEETELLALLN